MRQRQIGDFAKKQRSALCRSRTEAADSDLAGESRQFSHAVANLHQPYSSQRYRSLKTILRPNWRFLSVHPGGFALPMGLIQNSAPYAIRWAPKDIS
jgi:hypothetical protein